MAQQGFYPDPPSRRMGYDEDGTIVLFIPDNQTGTMQLSGSEMKNLNDEGSSEVGSPYVFTNIVFIFRELRDITHFYITGVSQSGIRTMYGDAISYSVNTTNGLDGNWTTVQSSFNIHWTDSGTLYSTFPYVRTLLEPLSIQAAKAVRFRTTSSNTGYYSERFQTAHIYGYKSPGQSPHRIIFCSQDGTELVQDFDYGDQPRNSERIWRPSETWNQGSALYIKNRSTSKLAQDVTVSMQQTSGDMMNHTTLSKDNITYGTFVNWSQIQPGEVVGPIYVRYSPSVTASLMMKTMRLKAVVGTWF